MAGFSEVVGVAASFARDNVDTDAIIPARFLKTTERAGLGKALFADLRKGADGRANDFVLNHPPFDSAEILVSGLNFGCGSSREHAPWALADFGIRCVLAGSFADIFANNCYGNGILPVAVADEKILGLMHEAAGKEERFVISLEAQEVRFADTVYRFEIEAGRKRALLEGRDAIANSLLHEGGDSGL